MIGRRRDRDREAADRLAKAQGLMAEAGYRGMGMDDVPADCVVSPDQWDGIAHYASRDQLVYSRATGRPVQALCGRVWSPTADPAGLPVCPRCEATYLAMPQQPPGRRH